MAGSEPEDSDSSMPFSCLTADSDSSMLNTPRNKKGKILHADTQGTELAANGQYLMQTKRKFAEIEEASENSKHIRAELEEAHEDLKRKSAELEDLKRANAELEKANGHLKSKNAELEEANGDLNLKIAELVEANRELKHKNAELEEANGEASECFIPLQTNKDWYKKEIQRLEAKNDSLECENQLLNLEKGVLLEHKLIDVLESKSQDKKVLSSSDQYEGLEETQLLKKENSVLMERITSCEAKNKLLKIKNEVLVEQLMKYESDKNGQQGEPSSE